MNGSHETSRPRLGLRGGGAEEEPAVRADRVFTGLTELVQQADGDVPSLVAPPPDTGVSTDGPAPTSPLPRSPADGEVHDFLLSARDALERTAKAVKVVRSQARATASDLTAVGAAIEQALEATNYRLMQVERLVLGGPAPDAERAELAMDQLRSVVRRSAESGGGRAKGG